MKYEYGAMSSKYSIEAENKLTAYLSGDIDHHTAAAMRTEIDHALRQNNIKILTLDFSGVTFMDSSGIGLVMGRQKLAAELGGRCRVADPPAYISKVMKISGIGRLCEIVDTRTPVRAGVRRDGEITGGEEE